ncbi:MAG: hypothetical protein AYP45_14055 [Candidatus Brocadia carolinensis]|uniref:Uncharacterized protein n=1 Tax=Candidatus Brocadia carolinensis TaxID=1004156 RepID=A0A1V4AR22_9BACT|nr:MAG: hypothetical protein AYP45_14055 [Candidatus Brocadia caroliniensis]
MKRSITKIYLKQIYYLNPPVFQNTGGFFYCLKNTLNFYLCRKNELVFRGKNHKKEEHHQDTAFKNKQSVLVQDENCR